MYDETSSPEIQDEATEQPQQQPQGAQLKLSDNEKKRLRTRIQEDYNNGIQDHTARMNRFLRYWRMWRDRVGAAGGEQGAANFHVPLTKWQLFARWAKEVDALLGDAAEIVAVPTAPSDTNIVRKVGRYMTWRVFTSMRITVPLVIFLFHKLCFGRAFAYAPYCRETFDVPGEGEQVDYEGPGFTPIWPDNIIVPAEDVQSIQDFSYVIRRYKATPQDLLDGEGTLYQGITDNWEKIHSSALQARQRDFMTDRLTAEKDSAEGVLYDNAASPRECLEVWEWYGRWRMLKGKADGVESNFKRRDMRESELVIRYLPDLDLIIGAQDLAELYPKMRKRRPIVESSLVKDGSYWCPSVPELLEDVELEMTATHNLATEGGEMSVGPLIFYRPGSGFDPKTFRYEPRMAVPCDDPQNQVKVVTLSADLQFPALRQQELMDIAERVVGITETNMGRQNDRPNAPRTLGQTQIFANEAGVRLSLDHRVVREDLGLICQHIWNVDSMYCAPEIFFRVAEEDANGVFDVANGFGKMTASERNGRYDFDLKFATSSHSKEQVKQEKAQVFQVLMALPIMQQNAVAQYLAADDFLKAYGMSGMGKYMPKPGPIDMPKDPTEEWALMLEGEDVSVNAMDDDQAHLAAHQKQLEQEQQKKPEHRDTDAENRMIAHILETQQAIQQKQIQAQAADAMGRALAPLVAGSAGIAQGGEASGAGGLDLSNILSQGAQ